MFKKTASILTALTLSLLLIPSAQSANYDTSMLGCTDEQTFRHIEISLPTPESDLGSISDGPLFKSSERILVEIMKVLSEVTLGATEYQTLHLVTKVGTFVLRTPNDKPAYGFPETSSVSTPDGDTLECQYLAWRENR